MTAQPAVDRVPPNERDTVVVVLRDETLLATVSDLRRRLAPMLEPGPSLLVVDVSGVRRPSAATIAVLLRARRQCAARGVRVVLRRPSRATLVVLRRAGLASTLEVEPA